MEVQYCVRCGCMIGAYSNLGVYCSTCGREPGIGDRYDKDTGQRLVLASDATSGDPAPAPVLSTDPPHFEIQFSQEREPRVVVSCEAAGIGAQWRLVFDGEEYVVHRFNEMGGDRWRIIDDRNAASVLASILGLAIFRVGDTVEVVSDRDLIVDLRRRHDVALSVLVRCKGYIEAMLGQGLSMEQFSGILPLIEEVLRS